VAVSESPYVELTERTTGAARRRLREVLGGALTNAQREILDTLMLEIRDAYMAGYRDGRAAAAIEQAGA
jgi:hypothetical protein